MKEIIKLVFSLQIITVYGCSFYGGYETVTNKNTKFIFANKSDDFYTGCARGFIKGNLLPYNVYKKIMKIYKE